MSTPNKARPTRALWIDLINNQIAYSSWHGKVLAERERLTASGEENFIEWAEAKRQLREELLPLQ